MPSQYHILTLNTLLKCCKNLNTWRGQVCDTFIYKHVESWQDFICYIYNTINS